MPFQGELMICVVCGKQEKSSPLISSEWRMLQVDEHGFYVCPDEFPDAKPSKEEYKKAYQVAIACCVNEILKDAGEEPLKEVEEYRAAAIRLRTKSSGSKGHGFQN